MSILVGCQSWSYEDWVTPAGGEVIFYPRGTRQGDMLGLYARVFETIEVDSTAYGVPQRTTVEAWREKTPDGFRFSLKVPREITHELSLRAAAVPVMEAFVKAVQHLREKLGMILIQLPASFESTKENAQNLRTFLKRLPAGARYAVEFRSPGWFVDWTYDELNERGVALALVEGPWIENELMFAGADRAAIDSAYVRVMGERDLEKFDRISRPRDENLRIWAERIASLPAAEVFVYVDNHYEGHAPATANKLKGLLGVPAVDPTTLEGQPSLF